MTSVKWNGREVQGRVRRKLLVAFIVSYTVIMLPISLFIILPIGLVLGTVLEPFLKLLGRRGVYRMEEDSFVIRLDREAFRRNNA